jgi:hypothetical protein
MAPEFIWLAGGIAGYVIVMFCNPLRGYFVDGFNLIRERGRLMIWLPIAAFSLVPLSFSLVENRADSEGKVVPRESRSGLEALVAGAADGAGLYTTVVRYKVADGARDLPVKSRVALSLGAMLWAVLAVGFQFCIMVALYLGVVMPERDPGWLGLLDFAWRRTLRYWPCVVFVGVVSALPLWLPAEGVVGVVLWPVCALAAAVTAFVQVSLLSGERELPAALATNFTCWAKFPHLAVWFIAIAGLHLFLLHASDVATSRLLEGSRWMSIAWRGLVEIIRAGMMAWLLAAWVLIYCTKTKNPSRRRIRP